MMMKRGWLLDNMIQHNAQGNKGLFLFLNCNYSLVANYILNSQK